MIDYRATLRVFDLESIPSLSTVVMGALQLAEEERIASLDFSHLQKPLVLGSGNAFFTAQIVLQGTAAVFGDESTYKTQLLSSSEFDGVVIFSASGKKHAISMMQESQKANLDVYLVTNTKDAEAAHLLESDHVFVFPKNREPYTYNTSTYFSPVFGMTGESAKEVREYIEKEVSKHLLRNFDDYDSYSLIIPSKFKYARAMLRTKFDELFGPMVTGRVFTDEEIKHAKTVVESGNELFISFGVTNEHYGLIKNRLQIPLPKDTDYGAMLAISYFVVGKLQEAHPPYFARSVEKYTKVASRIFGQDIKPIVE